MSKMVTGRSTREIAESRQLTQLLRKQIKKAEVWERAWKYCMKLASFSHAPVALKEYLRMEKFSDDEELVAEVFQVIKNYDIANRAYSLTGIDTIGYYYSIALLSQASCNRERYTDFFSNLCDEWIKEEHQKLPILYRNMKRLSKKYPDLKELEIRLAPYQ